MNYMTNSKSWEAFVDIFKLGLVSCNSRDILYYPNCFQSSRMAEDRKKCSSLSIPLISAFVPYDIWFDNAWYHLYSFISSVQHPSSPAQEVRNLKEETCDTGLVQRRFLGNLKHQSTSSWPSTFFCFFCFTINKLQSWWVFTLFACLKLPSYILHQWILSVLQFSFLHVRCCCNRLESVECT